MLRISAPQSVFCGLQVISFWSPLTEFLVGHLQERICVSLKPYSFGFVILWWVSSSTSPGRAVFFCWVIALIIRATTRSLMLSDVFSTLEGSRMFGTVLSLRSLGQTCSVLADALHHSCLCSQRCLHAAQWLGCRTGLLRDKRKEQAFWANLLP